ncbi:MAG TPA: MBL fold metallo-hydrolase [Candidatus Nitrosotalea sp.]|nr:MBL fold metallo-hydrolase [Candidatus Nitrosotalea sp.]
MKISTQSTIGRMLRLALCLTAAFLCGVPVGADSLYVEERTVTQLAEGVYMIRHKDPFPGWVNGNTTVIIGEREVLVVDSCQFSWFAQEDIAQIRQWTSKPVRWLVNTHWHEDHNSGNGEYLRAFPGLAILSHPATKSMQAETAPNYPRDVMRDATPLREKLSKRLETGKTDDGQPLTNEKREQTKRRLAQIEQVIAATKDYSFQLPTLTFESELAIDLGNREVRVMHLGRGNTAGDVVVFLPKEKIVASGDLLVRPVPFPFDGYPVEWIETLEKLDRLDADTIVPGHGEVMRDRTYLHLVRDAMKSVLVQVHEQLRKDDDAPLDTVKKAIDLKQFREKFAAGDEGAAKFFDYAMGDKFVELAYHEAKQR